MIGKKFKRLTVVGKSELRKRNRLTWDCVCVCGKTVSAVGDDLRAGNTGSCGCLKSEVSAAMLTTHGEYRSPEHMAWRAMIQRCEDSNSNRWKNYGGRGIRVCDLWRSSFEAFLSDVGRKPDSSHSLDRFPNVDGNYEPGNVRWASASQQSRNKTNNRFLEVNGKTVCLQELAERSGLDRHVITRRISRGLTPEQAIASPANPKRYEFNGQMLSSDELSALTGIPRNTMRRRLARHGEASLAIAEANKYKKDRTA